MSINKLTSIVLGRYVKQNVPAVTEIPDPLRQYLSDEFQSIEVNLQESADANLQVADVQPERPRKGMMRYAVSPWDPLSNGTQGLVVYNGSAWEAVQGSGGGGGGPTDAIQDTDFTANGLMKRTGNGTYTSVTDNSAAWDSAYSWGNHSSAGYLTSFTEADPVFTAHAASGVTTTKITNWDTAYGWGNHGSVGYLTSFTESDPVFSAHAAAGVTTTKITNWDTAYGWGNHGSAGYLTSHQDISGKANLSGATFTGLIISPNIDISTGDSVVTNIQTAAQSNFANTKTINIGTGYHNGGTTVVNIGPSSGTTNKSINLYGSTTFSDDADFNSTVDFNSPVNFFSDASYPNQYDQLISFKAKISSTTHTEAGRVAVVGSSYAPSKLIIGQDKAAITFFDGFGSKYIHPVDADTGLNTNGLCDLGSYSSRFKLGRFSSGTTTSSDKNEKRDIEELTEAELRVAARCKPLLRKYRRKDAYEWKGEEARIHFGIIAQDLEDAFTAEGLDAHRYAMFMEDTWYETEEGGTPYPSLEEVPQDLRGSAVIKTLQGVRYEQLLAFIIASI